MISRRAAMASGFAARHAAGLPRARAAAEPAVKIGNTMPYSGPASTYGVIGRTESAFFKMVNEQGGVAGRTIDFISLTTATARRRRSSRSAGWSRRIRSTSASRTSARRAIRPSPTI